jgi:hypothetical protein
MSRELVNLWPTSTAAQIVYCLRRPRAAIYEKAKRLLRLGLVEGNYAKNPNSRNRRTRVRPPPIRILQPPPVDDSLVMQPCSILELDQTRCHWPLGTVNDAATLFCGAAPVPGHRYCPHHLRMSRYSFL